MAAPTFTSQQLGSSADWGNPQQAWQRVRATNSNSFTPEQSAYVDQQIGAGTGAANPFGVGGTGPGGPSGPPQLNFMPTAAPDFVAPTRSAPTVASPTLGVVDPYTGPSKFAYDPFAGVTAADALADPGYGFRLDQGVKARDAGAAANGTLRGGAQQIALTKFGQDYGSDEFQKTWDRSMGAYTTNRQTSEDIYDRGKTAADDAYARNRLERDAKYDAGVGDWNRDSAERGSAYDASVQNANLTYAPKLQTWQAQQAAGSNNATSNFNRDWERDVYKNDDSYRRWVQQQNADQRRSEFGSDDEFRRSQAAIQHEEFLASLGNY